ncbi:hypothetical protein [Herbiconiux sp. A18JL235]|uniref:Sugar ABC transporter ATPase n=1 Tax=Herbiconiux sp. A18JL235 TaxID=3152363 RepID=A0AB39BGF5_9MICO
MSDDTTKDGLGEPFDQTNGLAEGLGGDDDGTLDGGATGEAGDSDRDEPDGLLGENFRGIADPVDPIADADRHPDGATPEDLDEAVTPYSEEGR